MACINLPYGSKHLPICLPQEALGEVVRPHDAMAVAAPMATIHHALLHPIGVPRLDQLVRPDHTVAIIIDDTTRTTPTSLIVPLVLEQIAGSGVRQQDVSIVIALGTHRPLTEAEIVAKVGATVASQYRIVNTSADEQDAHLYVGTSSNGIPAWVKREVAEADVRIGIGSIVPHVGAGFSGGAKIILPGVCNRLTVETFHAKETDLVSNQLGQLTSPIRLDLERFVDGTVRLDFLINTVMTAEHHLYRCVAGHFLEAHRAGVAYAREVYGVPVSCRYPVIIASAYPKDMDLWQSTNAIWVGDHIVEDGGTLILAAAAPEGHSVYPNLPRRLGMAPEALKQAFDHETLDDRMTAIFGIVLGRLKRRFGVALISNGLTRTDAEMMGFRYEPSVESAIAAAIDSDGARQHGIGVLTHGGITLPLLT